MRGTLKLQTGFSKTSVTSKCIGSKDLRWLLEWKVCRRFDLNLDGLGYERKHELRRLSLTLIATETEVSDEKDYFWNFSISPRLVSIR